MRSLVLVVIFIFAACSVFANDIWVDGYYRKDGTYVQGHHRTAPDGDRSNNFGPKKNNRDFDDDGIQNRFDRDDDNDGVDDNQDRRQYNHRIW